VFLELPKLSAARPQIPGADLWAWLFVHAPQLTAMPDDLLPGPHRAALELANKATFTPDELDAYRKVIDEIHQVQELADAKWAEGKSIGHAEGHAEGHKSGLAEGAVAGKIAAILAVLGARGIAVAAQDRARIESCRDLVTPDRWITRAATAASVEEVLAPPT
jgi:flagellar biosynthesis/type III secretory pathway protein FliH